MWLISTGRIEDRSKGKFLYFPSGETILNHKASYQYAPIP